MSWIKRRRTYGQPGTVGPPPETGRPILFEQPLETDNYYELYTINPDGSSETRLTTTSEATAFSWQNPTWSRDATKISAWIEYTEGPSGLYVMNADGSGQVQLTNYIYVSFESTDACRMWDPNGLGIWIVRSASELMYVPIDNSAITIVTPGPTRIDITAAGGGVRITPDGVKLVYQVLNSADADEIHVCNRDGSGDVTILTDPTGVIGYACADVFDDCTRLLLGNFNNDTFNGTLANANIDGTGLSTIWADTSGGNVYAGVDIECMAALSPDETQIVFGSLVSGANNLQLLPVTGGSPSTITTTYSGAGSIGLDW